MTVAPSRYGSGEYFFWVNAGRLVGVSRPANFLAMTVLAVVGVCLGNWMVQIVTG